MPRAYLIPLLLVASLTGFQPSRAQDPKPSQEPLLLAQPLADYQARRRQLIEKLATTSTAETVVVLRGEDDREKADFEEGRFRQMNDFAYLTGVNTPGAWLVILPKQKKATLYLPPKSGFSTMNGENHQLGPGKEAAEALGFDSVEPTSKLYGDLFAAIADPLRYRNPNIGEVVTLNPNPKAFDLRPDARFVRFLREGAPNASFRDLAPTLGEMRKFKTTTELALLQKAIDITGEANDAVIRTIRPDLFEYQLEAVVHGAFTNGGAMRPGFASIIGSGPNSTIPHYFANDRQMKDGELVVVDVGAEYKLYTADITRTYPVNGKFTPRQRELYQLVLDAQSEAAKKMKPGETRLLEMTGFVSNYLKKSPLRAKDENGNEQTMDRFFIHGLSHYLGMDVHDVGNGTIPMKVGEVFTIEPGLYIKSENIGIRIEDDYLMTSDGPMKLSKNIASTPDEIEAKIAKARKKD
jgi:Xaa-Pro aminopeptidase